LLSERGQRAGAITQLQQALTADPSLKPASDMLAQLGAAPVAAYSRYEQPAQQTQVQTIETRAATGGLVTKSEEFTTETPPSYHIGDDSRPAAEMAQRPNESGTSWGTTGSVSDLPATQPLPPVGE
jgi:hypothetical protein